MLQQSAGRRLRLTSKHWRHRRPGCRRGGPDRLHRPVHVKPLQTRLKPDKKKTKPGVKQKRRRFQMKEPWPCVNAATRPNRLPPSCHAISYSIIHGQQGQRKIILKRIKRIEGLVMKAFVSRNSSQRCSISCRIAQSGKQDRKGKSRCAGGHPQPHDGTRTPELRPARLKKGSPVDASPSRVFMQQHCRRSEPAHEPLASKTVEDSRLL